MTSQELEAIRARNAECGGLTYETGDTDIADRRALLAEVDWLLADNEAWRRQFNESEQYWSGQLASALPVIEAARGLLLVHSIHYQFTDRDFDALRSALDRWYKANE